MGLAGEILACAGNSTRNSLIGCRNSLIGCRFGPIQWITGPTVRIYSHDTTGHYAHTNLYDATRGTSGIWDHGLISDMVGMRTID